MKPVAFRLMRDSEDQRRGMSSGATWSLSILGTLVVYALSIGPVGKIAKELYGPTPPPSLIEATNVIYAPLGFAVQFQPVRDFYIWYFKVWGID